MEWEQGIFRYGFVFIKIIIIETFIHISGSTSEVSSEDIATDSEYELDVSVLDKLGNTCLLEGPTGSGKTAAVFALAAEMGFNVLEVNASRNRTGKQVKFTFQVIHLVFGRPNCISDVICIY